MTTTIQIFKRHSGSTRKHDFLGDFLLVFVLETRDKQVWRLKSKKTLTVCHQIRNLRNQIVDRLILWTQMRKIQGHLNFVWLNERFQRNQRRQTWKESLKLLKRRKTKWWSTDKFQEMKSLKIMIGIVWNNSLISWSWIKRGKVDEGKHSSMKCESVCELFVIQDLFH